jgi:hypothetical protein
VLTIARNALLNEPAGAVFTLTVTSTVTGRDETYPIIGVISGSILAVTVYNQCHAPTVDQPCSIAAGGPAPVGTT